MPVSLPLPLPSPRPAERLDTPRCRHGPSCTQRTNLASPSQAPSGPLSSRRQAVPPTFHRRTEPSGTFAALAMYDTVLRRLTMRILLFSYSGDLHLHYGHTGVCGGTSHPRTFVSEGSSSPRMLRSGRCCTCTSVDRCSPRPSTPASMCALKCEPPGTIWTTSKGFKIRKGARCYGSAVMRERWCYLHLGRVLLS